MAIDRDIRHSSRPAKNAVEMLGPAAGIYSDICRGHGGFVFERCELDCQWRTSDSCQRADLCRARVGCQGDLCGGFKGASAPIPISALKAVANKSFGRQWQMPTVARTLGHYDPFQVRDSILCRS